MFRVAVILASALALAGCMTTEDVTRAPFSNDIVAPNVELARSYDLRDISVHVPRDLSVSEENSIKPRVDIVWRGDPMGDRYAQIEALFEAAAQQSKSTLDGSTPVVAKLVVSKFHGLTERTRWTLPGDYDIDFELVVRNAVTGEIVEGPRLVDVELVGPHRSILKELEAQGQTEKVIVINMLEELLIDELSDGA